MIGNLFLFMLTVAMFGCAEPKYAPKNAQGVTNQKSVVESWPVSHKKIWLDWEKKPTTEDFGSFILKIGRENLADQSAMPEDFGGDVAVILWMPSMGHGSSPVTVTKVDTGTYRASQVFFTMPGDWEIRVQRIMNGAMVEQSVFALRF